MARNGDLTAIYIILAKAFLAGTSYDAKGAFILLHSIAEGLGERTPVMVAIASNLHIIAAQGDVEGATRDARRSMMRLVAILEQELRSGASA